MIMVVKQQKMKKFLIPEKTHLHALNDEECIKEINKEIVSQLKKKERDLPVEEHLNVLQDVATLAMDLLPRRERKDFL